jgi:hypothetical protein
LKLPGQFYKPVIKTILISNHLQNHSLKPAPNLLVD